jgi:hypothetical protein
MSTTSLTGLSSLTRTVATPQTAGMVSVAPHVIESVITIKNSTSTTMTYYIQFGSTQWQTVKLMPGQVMVHRAAGADRLGVIQFGNGSVDDYRQIRYTLYSKNFVTGGPEVWNRTTSDGMMYNFVVNPQGTAWDLTRESGINTTRNASLRAAAAQGFENLGTNFEIIGSSTSRGAPYTYNCIAWSLGNVNQWVFPTDMRVAGNMQYWDSLYGAQGYRRMSTLDLSYQPGYEKVVVYWGQNSGIPGITHASLQETDGMWSCKTGAGYLIKIASPYQVAGQLYGQPSFVYIRPLPA